MYAPDPAAPRQIAPAPGISDPAVVLRCMADSRREWRLHEPSSEAVQEITELLRQRRRWRDVPTTAERIADRCVDLLAGLSLSDDDLRVLAGAGTLEVDVTVEQWTACAFPWEFVLAEATRAYRHEAGSRNLLAVRHMVHGPAAPIARPNSLMLIESAPGRLGEVYSFASERQVVLASLDLPSSEPLMNPDRDQIRDRLQREPPAIVHFTGIDSRQGAVLLNQESYAQPPGVFLRDGADAVSVPFSDVATLLTEADRKPALVSLNFYNSAQLAMLVVEEGAHAAIGFQDEIDDTVAELFFAAFYAEWRRSWELFEAFRRAWLRLAPYGAQLRGTGITLWSRRSLFEPATWVLDTPVPPPVAPDAPASPRRRRAPTKPSPPEPLPSALPPSAAPTPPISVVAPPSTDPISVDYEAPERLNYSLLHNNHPLFTKFTIRRQRQGVYPGVCVDVQLHAGMETARYQASFTLSDDQPIVDLAKKEKKDAIRVSLTSQLARSLAESVYTSIFVHVQLGKETIRQQTHRVELLPIDEWKDDDMNRHWLPSFVLPRDVAVRRIVDAAQRYLVALADDSGAGFDGYQSFDSSAGTLDEKARGVDAQVKALWWGIISDFNLSYINPPPTFSAQSQRLRTPSDVVSSKRGTCIDLTLLLASCLEYVDIYPVIFLLKDHAFPGYVRSEQSHELIRKYAATSATDGTTSPTARPSDPPEAQVPWMLPVARYAEVLKLVQAGHIVPLETVALTQRAGFDPSVAEGLQNLRSARYFESLFDVRLAREARVTPLPIGNVPP